MEEVRTSRVVGIKKQGAWTKLDSSFEKKVPWQTCECLGPIQNKVPHSGSVKCTT